MLGAFSKRSSRCLRRLLVALVCVSPLCAQSPDGWVQDQNWLFLGPLGNPNGCGGGGGDGMLNNWIAPFDIATITPAEDDEVEIDFGGPSSRRLPMSRRTRSASGTHEPLASGGTITWNVSRSKLRPSFQGPGGISYNLSKPPESDSAVFVDGTVDDVEIADPKTIPFIDVDRDDLRIFDAAHNIGDKSGRAADAGRSGGLCISGTSMYDPGQDVYTITGSGDDIWVNGDQFEYAYKKTWFNQAMMIMDGHRAS